jgi:hypothetical protein
MFETGVFMIHSLAWCVYVCVFHGVNTKIFCLELFSTNFLRGFDAVFLFDETRMKRENFFNNFTDSVLLKKIYFTNFKLRSIFRLNFE